MKILKLFQGKIIEGELGEYYSMYDLKNNKTSILAKSIFIHQR